MLGLLFGGFKGLVFCGVCVGEKEWYETDRKKELSRGRRYIYIHIF